MIMQATTMPSVQSTFFYTVLKKNNLQTTLYFSFHILYYILPLVY